MMMDQVINVSTIGRPVERPTGTMRFGRFAIVPASRTFLADGRPVELGARAFDLLVILVQHRGTVVSKDQIMRGVWPTTTVDECNLRFQMTVLRKALGDCRDLVKTIPGRGYLLCGDDTDTVEVNHPPGQRQLHPFPTSESAAMDALRVLMATLRRNPGDLAMIETLLSG